MERASEAIGEVVSLSAPTSPSVLFRYNAGTSACEPVDLADWGDSFLELGEALEPRRNSPKWSAFFETEPEAITLVVARPAVEGRDRLDRAHRVRA